MNSKLKAMSGVSRRATLTTNRLPSLRLLLRSPMLSISSIEAATMTLYGLCATGNVHCLNNQGELIETIDIEGKPAFFRASDVRSLLTDWSKGHSHQGVKL